jgi:hypothetical protein
MAGGGEKLWKNCRKILRALLQKIFLQLFHNYSLPPLPVEGPQNLSTIFLQFFHNSSLCGRIWCIGLAWRRIVEGIIVEKLWKHLVNAAPVLLRARLLLVGRSAAADAEATSGQPHSSAVWPVHRGRSEAMMALKV